MSTYPTHYASQTLPSGSSVFYREAGDPHAPTLLLLHGYPTSSSMFRELIPLLAGQFHLIAPDLPGFGHTTVPAGYQHSFTSMAELIDEFIEAKGLTRFALYVFDYGAPTGFRLALKHPERITALISQNGNAYEEGLSQDWNPIQRYWSEPSMANREALRGMLSPAGVQSQYSHGSPAARLSPDGYTLDSALLARPGQDEVQLDLFLDYASNVELYPAFQRWLREQQPPVLAVWGKNDPFFLPAGAKAFQRDVPKAEIHFFETGHFALETHAGEIAVTIADFLRRTVPVGK